MVLLYLSIPLMVLGVAIATLPLLLTMWRQDRARRDGVAVVSRIWNGREVEVREDLPVAA